MNNAFPEAFLQSFIATLSGFLQKKACVLVAIDGEIASGKSTLARHIWEKTDSVWTGPDEFLDPLALKDYWPSGKKPFRWSTFKNDLLMPLHRGRNATYQPYDWDNHKIGAAITIAAKGIIIVEGMFTLEPEIKDMFDFRIWVEGNTATRMKRLAARETPESYDLFLKRWLPAEKEYVGRVRPWDNADFVMAGIDLNISSLKQKLS